MEEQIHAFKKHIVRLANLDIDNEHVLKQILQRLVNRIEVSENGSLKIHYNITTHVLGA